MPNQEIMVVLPLELERKIFEIAVLLHPKCALKLVLVAHYVREWVEPEIYRVLRMDGERTFPPIYKDEMYLRPPRELDVPRLQRFGPHVRHAMLCDCPWKDIIVVLQHCTNLHNVAFWSARGRSEALAQSAIASLEALPYLRKLSIDAHSLFHEYSDLPFPFDIPMFRNITHLDIMFTKESLEWWSKISSLRKLSHLSIAPNFTTGFVDGVLSACPTLQRLMFASHYRSKRAWPQPDKRLMHVIRVDWRMYPDFWVACVRNGEDEWMAAEKRRYIPVNVT
ncbi:hypothetical protein B0H34DRAFT_802496 [Crassisporium funariophilum]|nr:hypothetical protein B0H34DRAFT_802496 [Crassisporium funariophilum]